MDTENVITRGIKLAQKGDFEEALGIFEEALKICEGIDYLDANQAAKSYYALSLATVRQEFRRSINICSEAAINDYHNPVIYLNASKIYRLYGKRNMAVKALRKGLRIDNTNMVLIKELEGLGARRRPFIGFLSRNNVINTLIGAATYKFGKDRTTKK